MHHIDQKAPDRHLSQARVKGPYRRCTTDACHPQERRYDGPSAAIKRANCTGA